MVAAEEARVSAAEPMVAPGVVRVVVAGPEGCPARGWPASTGRSPPYLPVPQVEGGKNLSSLANTR